MQSSNPAFRDFGAPPAGRSGVPSTNYLQQMWDQPSYQGSAQRRLTLDDVVLRTAIVLGVGVVSAVLTMTFTSTWALALPALVIGLVLSLIIMFKRSSNPALILGYAVAEGVLLGAITAAFQSIHGYEGIGIQALVGTFAVFGGMLVVYRTKAIRVTPKFTRFMVGAGIGVLVLVLFRALGAVFGFASSTYNGGPLSVVISLAIIAFAALSFLLDFDQITRAVQAGVPARTAWYFAFGLMVTMVWLYLEILRLLGSLRSD